MNSKVFTKWWRGQSAERRHALVKRMSTTYVRMAQIASGYRPVTVERAAAIEAATDGELTRGELCETCRRCPYYNNED